MLILIINIFVNNGMMKIKIIMQTYFIYYLMTYILLINHIMCCHTCYLTCNSIIK